MYARARGSELISPDDLLHACEFFVELNSTFRLRTFANGVRVVEYAGRSTETIAEEVATLLAQHEYLSASSYAKIKGIPPMLAEVKCIRLKLVLFNNFCQFCLILVTLPCI